MGSYDDTGQGYLSRLPGYGSNPPADLGDEFIFMVLRRREVRRMEGTKVRVTLTYGAGQRLGEEPVEGELGSFWLACCTFVSYDNTINHDLVYEMGLYLSEDEGPIGS